MTTLKTNYDYVNEYVLFYNTYFVIADSYTVIETGLSDFNQDQSITYAELNQYMNNTKNFKLETIRVLPELSLT